MAALAGGMDLCLCQRSSNRLSIGRRKPNYSMEKNLQLPYIASGLEETNSHNVLPDPVSALIIEQ